MLFLKTYLSKYKYMFERLHVYTNSDLLICNQTSHFSFLCVCVLEFSAVDFVNYSQHQAILIHFAFKWLLTGESYGTPSAQVHVLGRVSMSTDQSMLGMWRYMEMWGLSCLVLHTFTYENRTDLHEKAASLLRIILKTLQMQNNLVLRVDHLLNTL